MQYAHAMKNNECQKINTGHANMNNIPWGLIRSFLAVVEQGSLSGAARQLGVSQPTLSRDIQALEKHTGLNLFRRGAQGVSLTGAGQTLVEPATIMARQARSFARKAAGLSTELSGDIRISANELMGIYQLPAAIAAFRRRHAAVQVEIVISNDTSSLSKREADVALRMYRPTQPDLIVTRLPDVALGFYASEDYIAERGAPASLQELREHAIIGYDQRSEFIDGVRKLGLDLRPGDFGLRTDNLVMQLALARAGAGILVTHCAVARQHPELKPVLRQVRVPPLECWIACHGDTQYNARILALRRFLGEWFREGGSSMP